MDLLYPRRTVWMFVIKDVLMTLSGKFPTLKLWVLMLKGFKGTMIKHHIRIR